MCKKLVMISGKLHSGKNAFAEFLVQEAQQRGVTIEQGMLASLLKDSCCQDFQGLAAFLRKEYNKLVDLGVPPAVVSWMNVEDPNFYEDKTPLTRILLQTYGTDIFRNRVTPDYWLEKYENNIIHSPNDLFVVTDFRMPNEIAFLKEAGEYNGFDVVTIRVERPDIDRSGAEHQHISETALDQYGSWDYVIQNSSTLEELKASAAHVLNQLVEED